LSCSRDDEAASQKNIDLASWKTLDQPGYSIQYPPDWEVEWKRNGTPSVLHIESPSTADGFRELVALWIDDNVGNLDDYIENDERVLAEGASNYKKIEGRNVWDDSGEHHERLVTLDQSGFHVKLRLHTWVVNGKAYTLTLACTTDSYDKYQDVGKKIMHSFRIK
jgi:hypothetical protein